MYRPANEKKIKYRLTEEKRRAEDGSSRDHERKEVNKQEVAEDEELNLRASDRTSLAGKFAVTGVNPVTSAHLRV